MKAILAAIVLGTVLTAAGLYAAQEPSEMPKPRKEHEWLKQLAGEWDTEAEIVMDPTKPPVKQKGTESNRMIGPFWAMGEHKGEFQGQPFTGVLTLGYDAEDKKYVATWIDSLTGYMWKYQGNLDASGMCLLLDTEGPGFDGKPTRFRETIEIKDKDTKVFTSATEQDGKWVTHLTVRYQRKK